ncbi:ABC transporter substrate-binding protein [Streptomyces sp. NPDC005907]|uniref:ABC transporter substrate-binding protein n=1 Tax=Streptomyces sp. NPDC005907 TaxID=3154571 RepID=UPI0033C1C293
MTGRRRTRSSSPSRPSRPLRATLLAAGALAVCASIAVGCGVVPGVTGGSGGDSITVMTWAPEETAATNKPGMPAMAQAYARWVNSRGGINGRELRVLTCNDHNDSVDAAKCARRAAREDVVAVVGSYSQHGSSFLSPLQGAGIPYIGGYGLTDDEFKSPFSYPVNGGQPALLAGLGEELGETCGPVVLVRPDTIAGDELPVLIGAGLERKRHAPAVDIRAAEDSTEYSAHVSQALARASSDPAKRGCVVSALGDRTAAFMDSFRHHRDDYPKVRTASVLGSVDQTVIDATGGPSGPYENAYVTSWYPASSDARWNAMKTVIREQAFDDNRINPSDAGVQTTWIAYNVLHRALEALGDGEVSARTVRRKLDDGLEVTTGRLTPTLSWRFGDLLAAVDFPRLINADVTVQVVRQGRLVSARRGFVNVSKTLESAASNSL